MGSFRLWEPATHHLAHLQTVSDRSVRWLANFLKPATIAELCLVMTADHFGRPPKPRVIHEGVTSLRAKAEELRLRDAAPKPLLQGRHPIARGLPPGVQFGKLLAAASEAQLEAGSLISPARCNGWRNGVHSDAAFGVLPGTGLNGWLHHFATLSGIRSPETPPSSAPPAFA